MARPAGERRYENSGTPRRTRHAEQYRSALVAASRLLGDPLPERVAGIDLMEALFARAEETGRSVYVLGARAEVLERAMRELRRRHPRLRIAGYRDGYFGADEEDDVASGIRAAA